MRVSTLIILAILATTNLFQAIEIDKLKKELTTIKEEQKQYTKSCKPEDFNCVDINYHDKQIKSLNAQVHILMEEQDVIEPYPITMAR